MAGETQRCMYLRARERNERYANEKNFKLFL